MTSRKTKKIVSSEISNSESEINSCLESASLDSDGDFERPFIEGKKFEYEIDISEPIFEIHRVVSGNKVRNKVKPSWSPLLNHRVWNEFKADCVWSFKRADVISNEVRAVGHCSFDGCNATIKVHTMENLMKMKVNIDDFDGNVLHDGKKRRVFGAQKAEIDKMLKEASAAKVHRKLVKSTMEPGDVEPPHLPTKNALRIRKHRNRIVDGQNDVYKALSSMADRKYKKIIHYIGYKPFYVIYSSPLQRKWYRTQTVDNRRIISLDATGLLVIPPEGSRISNAKTVKSNGQTKYQTIFLYAIILRGIVPVPVAVMISQDHTMRFLTFWLSIWSFNNEVPDEIILDQSAALFGACTRAFTNYKSTNAYISACMDCLLNDAPPPPVFLRIDRYHFVCTIHRIKKFRKMDPLKRILLKAVFGLLLLCDDLKAVKKIVTDLFTLIRYRYMTKECKNSLDDLQAACETHNISIDKEEEYDDGQTSDGQNSDDDRGENIVDHSENDSYKETSSYRYFSTIPHVSFFIN